MTYNMSRLKSCLHPLHFFTRPVFLTTRYPPCATCCVAAAAVTFSLLPPFLVGAAEALLPADVDAFGVSAGLAKARTNSGPIPRCSTTAITCSHIPMFTQRVHSHTILDFFTRTMYCVVPVRDKNTYLRLQKICWSSANCHYGPYRYSTNHLFLWYWARSLQWRLRSLSWLIFFL